MNTCAVSKIYWRLPAVNKKPTKNGHMMSKDEVLVYLKHLESVQRYHDLARHGDY